MKEFDFNDDLYEFFSVVSSGKKEHKKQLENLISNSFEEMVLNPLKSEVKKKKKLSKIKSKKSSIDEEIIEEQSLGLLAEPSNIKVQQDPLTPLNKNFATHEDLQKHYQLFLSRIQQQLSTLGGGGETRLEFLDDVDRNSAKTDNYFLKYNASLKKWIGDPADGVGITSIVSVSGITTFYQALSDDDYIGINCDVPVTISLPLNPTLGKKIIIKDEGNKLSTYTATIRTGVGVSVENDSSLVMEINHQSFTFFYNGQNWYVI